MDSLATKRGSEGGWVVERLLNQVNNFEGISMKTSLTLNILKYFFPRETSSINCQMLQLLIELDGADQRKGVYVIGATNRY